MDTNSGSSAGHVSRPTGPKDRLEEQDERSVLLPRLLSLWAYRRIIGLVVAAAAGLCVVGGVSLYLSSPVERTGSIQIRLLFQGAAEGLYPNGIPFSAAELVSTPVAAKVYRNNDLKRFGGFSQFKTALVVLRSSPALQLLDSQYSARLADLKLSAADRARLEEEFTERRATLIDPVYSVSMRRVERLRSMPRDLVEKVLNDLLAEWAESATARGALSYNVATLSRNVLLPNILKDEDYLVAVDVLRVQVNRILTTISQMESLPGALTFRTAKVEKAAGEFSLGEVRTNLQDILQLQLDPMISLIKSNGLTKDARTLQIYIEGRLSDLELDRARITATMSTVQEALKNYISATSPNAPAGSGRGAPGAETTLMPQLTEGFLDRLMELVQPQNTDVAYRQRLSDEIIGLGKSLALVDREVTYYQGLRDTIRNMRAPTSVGPEKEAVETRSAKALAEIGTSIDRVMEIYEGLSAQNLNPSTLLYSISSPFSLRTVPSLTVSAIVSFSALIMALAFLGACLACLGYDLFTKS